MEPLSSRGALAVSGIAGLMPAIAPAVVLRAAPPADVGPVGPHGRAPTVQCMLLDTLASLLQTPPPERPANTVEYFPGFGVLFTAPHAAPHALHPAPHAGGARKKHDGATGQMAQTLSTHTDAAALVARPPWTGNANADPLELCPFKQRMVELIESGSVHTVVDLHGMASHHGIDVCIGIGYDTLEDPIERLCGLLDEAGLSWGVNKPFAGRGAGTVRSNARTAGAGALQLEIGPACRNPLATPEQTAALLNTLSKFARSLT